MEEEEEEEELLALFGIDLAVDVTFVAFLI
jgi:hypothetical protein